jgi:hypothetical protein
MNSDSNIVSSDLSTVDISPALVEVTGYKDYDLDILREALWNNNGQTDYQSTHFVANSQITPYKKVRQALMELETRHHAFVEIRNSLRKAEVLDKKFARDAAFCREQGDDLQAELIDIDKEKNQYDIGIWKRKLKQAEGEIQQFMDIIKRYAPNKEDLKFFTEENPEEERKYWILRMGKQAAMDILAFGRLGSGNMDSIAMMDKDEQIEALTIAIQYSGIVNANVAAISESVQQQVNELISGGTLELPMIEDGLEVEADVFNSLESKINGERISELPGVSQA